KTLLGVAVTVHEGNGRDVVNISPATHDLHTILGTVTVYGGTGHNVLNINDQANSVDTNYTLTASHLLSRSSAPIGFANIDQIHINGGGGHNMYNVLCTENGFTTTLRTGGGNDRVNIYSTGYDSTLNVEGQGGQVAVNLGHNGTV